MNPVCHYTKFDNLQGIFKDCHGNRHNNYLTFWASSAYCMDDQMEMNFGYPLVQYVLKEFENGKDITDNQSLSKRVTEQIQYIYQPSDKFFLPQSRTPFVISFTREYNNEYFWKNFGDEGKGVCLVFDADKLGNLVKEQNDQFITDIAYLDDNHSDDDYVVWSSLIEIVKYEAARAHKLIPIICSDKDKELYKKMVLDSICPIISASVKRGEYRKEHEVRWMSIQDISCANTREKENGENVQYIEQQIPFSCFDGILFGPRFEKDKEFVSLLHENEISLMKSDHIIV